jgi:NAD(P)-dependent dehydrogenase (short-subunit alcohol dehydrogenase family)
LPDSLGKEHNIRAFAVHPGRIVNTDLARYMTDEELKGFGIYREDSVIIGCPGVKSVEQDAATTVWCTVSPQLSGKDGV